MRILALIVTCLLLASCVKDDVDVASLTTNPLDQDYTGPAYIMVTSSSLTTPTQGVTNHRLLVEVDESAFTQSFDYELNVLEIGTNEVTVVPPNTPGGNTFTYENSDIQTGGIDYCYDISIRVVYSTARAENFCYTL